MKQPVWHQALVVAATIWMLLQPSHVLSAEPPATQSVEVSIASFLGPLPGTTYVYHFIRNGALVDGQERLVKGISRKDPSRITLHTVARLAEGRSPVPIESSADDVLRLSDRSLELIDSDGRVFVLLGAPLKVGRTWARATMEWRPAETRPGEPPTRRGATFDPKVGTWTALAGTCRIERLYRATVFGKERIVVVVSTSLELDGGITETSIEEWASGLGMVGVVRTVKDSGRRDLEVIEQRLVRVLRPS